MTPTALVKYVQWKTKLNRLKFRAAFKKRTYDLRPNNWMLIDQRFNLGLEYNNGNQNTKLHVKKCFYIKKMF